MKDRNFKNREYRKGTGTDSNDNGWNKGCLRIIFKNGMEITNIMLEKKLQYRIIQGYTKENGLLERNDWFVGKKIKIICH